MLENQKNKKKSNVSKTIKKTINLVHGIQNNRHLIIRRSKPVSVSPSRTATTKQVRRYSCDWKYFDVQIRSDVVV